MTTFNRAKLETVLQKYLSLSTQTKSRYEPALALFDKEVADGVPHRKATQHALERAFKGLKDEKTRLQNARKDAGLTAASTARGATAALKKVTTKQRTASEPRKGLGRRYAEWRRSRKAKANDTKDKAPSTYIFRIMFGMIAGATAAGVVVWAIVTLSAAFGQFMDLFFPLLFIIAGALIGAFLGWASAANHLLRQAELEEHQAHAKEHKPKKKSKSTVKTA